ncbi:MAG: D-hexose-6-phosphate mutarotase [Tepidisphaeraceae bacterium]
MDNVEELHRRFGVSGVVKVDQGRGGLPRIMINGAKGVAEIYLFGAHVTHFQPRGAAPVLFLSRNSLFDGRTPIRGGIPLVFPWFGPRADMPQLPPHGVARTKRWEIESCDLRGDGSVRVVLGASSDEQTKQLWPHAFELRFIMVASDYLDMTLEVRNVSKEAVEFEEALHTYLAVADVEKISIEGLAGSEFLDRADGERQKKQPDEPIRITGETDRLYYTSAGSVTVRDPGLRRSIVVEKARSDATVVWNPWLKKATAMTDLGADQWQSMVCVETANARQCKVKLAGGLIHRMTTRISVEGL